MIFKVMHMSRRQRIFGSAECGVFGINHTSASLKVREECALRIGDYGRLQKTFPRIFNEVVLLTTCNRIEIYFMYDAQKNSRHQIRAVIRAFLKRHTPHTVLDALYMRFGKAALSHLYEVASGIDSMVIGETEILSQVRNARLEALRQGASGKTLDWIFIRARNFGARMRMETSISRGITSITTLLLTSLKDAHGGISHKRIVIYGAGEIATKLALIVAKESPQKLLIINRTRTRAIALRKFVLDRVHTKPPEIRMAQPQAMRTHLQETDMVFTAVRAKKYVINPRDISPRCGNITFVDLGVPRNVNPAIQNARKGIRVFNIEHFRNIADRALRERRILVPHIRKEIKKNINTLFSA